MKFEDSTGCIWFFVDEYGDIDTEFFWLEEKEGEMPHQMEKASWDTEKKSSTPTRARIAGYKI